MPRCLKEPFRTALTAHQVPQLSRLPPALFLIALFLLFRTGFRAAESSLVLVNAGVESAEDAPFVPPGYKFLPGEPVYVSFQIAGFSVNSSEEKNVRTIALTWQASAFDAQKVALAETVSGEIKTELAAEDKKWSPIRRVSFAIPAFVAAGEYHIHLVVKDMLANVEASKDIPFQIGGTQIRPSDGIQVENLRFSRTENGPSLEVPAYRPGDPVFATFDMVGFSNTPQNEYHLSYGITVLRPDGKPFLEQFKAADLTSTSFYPAKFIPANVEVTTASSNARGVYVLILTVKDLIANRTAVTKQSFTLE